MSTHCLGLMEVPCTLMRGGTSRGAFFQSHHLPHEPKLRDQVLLAAMGSPHPIQVDGIGGGHSLTSKVAIVGPSSIPAADLDYLFAQVSVNEPLVDTRASCGNLLAAVGPFAVEAGLVSACHPATLVRIHNTNTGMICEAHFGTPGQAVDYGGDQQIDGLAGRAAPIRLTFLNAQGAITGSLFPTGSQRDVIQNLSITAIDYSIPVIIISARDLGLTGTERPEAISADTTLMSRIESVRLEAGERMGLGNVSRSVSPKVALVSSSEKHGAIVSRYLTPWSCHISHAVTGGMAIAVACTMEGTVAAGVLGGALPPEGMVRIEHPAGGMDIDLFAGSAPSLANVPKASIIRTARKLFQGDVLIPQGLWPVPADPFASQRKNIVLEL